MKRSGIIGAILALTFYAVAGTATAETIREMHPGNPDALGTWLGFIEPDQHVMNTGTSISVEDVASDFRRDNPKHFRSRYSREQTARMIRARLGREDMSYSDIASFFLSDQVQTVPCEGTIETMAYNGQGSLKWIERKCYKGEKNLQAYINGVWTDLLSLGCLNPLNGEVAAEIADPCSARWSIPEGVTPNRNTVVVFVPEAAIKCLPKAVTCAGWCERWMWGGRGRPERAEIASALDVIARDGNGKAFWLPSGVSEISLPDNLLIDPLYCDTREHEEQDADFMIF